jgi:hypothetical protein
MCACAIAAQFPGGRSRWNHVTLNGNRTYAECILQSDEAVLGMSVTTWAAENERNKGKLRTRDALVARHRKGYVTGGLVYGYRNVRENSDTSSGNAVRL